MKLLNESEHPISPEQRREIERYRAFYVNDPNYALGADRRLVVGTLLLGWSQHRDGYLDVACGRGESLEIADDLGYTGVAGAEVVPELVTPKNPRVVPAAAWGLPFGHETFDVVSCFDALEHLLPADAKPTVLELARVARKRILLTISNCESGHQDALGDLHVNRRPYADWDRDLRAWLLGWHVIWRQDLRTGISEAWEILHPSLGEPA